MRGASTRPAGRPLQRLRDPDIAAALLRVRPNAVNLLQDLCLGVDILREPHDLFVQYLDLLADLAGFRAGKGVRDGVLIGVIGKWLNAGIVEKGQRATDPFRR